MSTRSLSLDAGLQQWIVENYVGETPVQRELRLFTAALPEGRMQISPEQGRYMHWLLRTLAATRAIEVGTFTGYSALWIAGALPAGGRLVCCELDQHYASIAQRHWQQAGLSDRIDLRLGPAGDTLAQLAEGESECYDFVFIDADKPGYHRYYEVALRLLRKGGVVAIDNALWSGRVADPTQQDEDTRAIRDLVAHVMRDVRVEACLVPIGDGLLLATLR